MPVVAGFVLTTWWIVFEQGFASAAREALYQPTLILVVIGLTLLSAGFHEIGHAAACRFSGARPGRMGVGLYLVWPAFYTDVSDSYRLSRGGRLRVDLGGLYFNAIFAVATLGVWFATHWDPLLLAVAAQPLMMARQLARSPLRRYHILADLVGVPDLFRHIKPTLLGLLPTRSRRRGGATLKAWARTVVTLWVLAVVPVLVALLAMMVVMLPRIAATAWDSFGLQARALEAGWGRADPATVTTRLFAMLMIVLPVAGIVYLLVRVGRAAVRKVVRVTAGRPVLRSGAAFAFALLLASLTWAWWPGGDRYQPIGPHDRGRVFDLPRLVAAAEPEVTRSHATAYVAPVLSTPARAVPHAPEPAAAVAAAPEPAPAPGPPAAPKPPHARPAAHAQWMVVLLPKRRERPALAFPLPAPHGAHGVISRRPAVASPPPAVLPSEIPPTPVADGASEVVVVPSAQDEGRRPVSGCVVPFDPPPEPRAGDNQALAVNTTDRSSKYAVALSLVWVTDGGPVDQRNSAFAAAGCTETESLTVAVAFQTIFVVGYAQVVTPVNTGEADNYECTACRTAALAVQLVATLTRSPGEQALGEIDTAWRKLQDDAKNFELRPLGEVYAELRATRAQLLDILARDGALEPGPTATSTSEKGTTAAPGDPMTTTTTTEAPATPATPATGSTAPVTPSSAASTTAPSEEPRSQVPAAPPTDAAGPPTTTTATVPTPGTPTESTTAPATAASTTDSPPTATTAASTTTTGTTTTPTTTTPTTTASTTTTPTTMPTGTTAQPTTAATTTDPTETGATATTSTATTPPPTPEPPPTTP